MEKFFGFNDAEDIRSSFAEYGEDNSDDPSFPTDDEILFAYYNYEDYSGEADILFVRDGKLYEAGGSHCSCNGLEGQWSPSETTWEALKKYDLDYQYQYGMDPEARKAWNALIDAHTNGEG